MRQGIDRALTFSSVFLFYSWGAGLHSPAPAVDGIIADPSFPKSFINEKFFLILTAIRKTHGFQEHQYFQCPKNLFL